MSTAQAPADGTTPLPEPIATLVAGTVPESAAVQGRDALKWTKEVLEATALIAVAGIAMFTFTHQVAYMVATFVVTAVLLAATAWLAHRVFRLKVTGDRVALMVVVLLALVALTSSGIKIYYWKSITDPASISDERSTMMESAQDEETKRMKAVRTLLAYKLPEADKFLDYRGDTIELLLTKKSWVESLRIVKLRVITDRIDELPQGVQAISTQTKSDEVPVIFRAYLRKPGDPFDPEFHETRGTEHGIVALTKDKPSLIMFIKCDPSVAGVRGVVTVHAEIEVADNESLISRTIVSKPVRLVFN